MFMAAPRARYQLGRQRKRLPMLARSQMPSPKSHCLTASTVSSRWLPATDILMYLRPREAAEGLSVQRLGLACSMLCCRQRRSVLRDSFSRLRRRLAYAR